MQEQTYKVKVEFENPVDGVKVLMLKGEKGDKGDPAGVVNEHSASTTDAYSANYVNNTIYTKTEVDGKVSGVYHYKGSVATYEDLPSSDLTVGDVYNVETDGKNYAWTGSDWDSLGGTVDFSSYYTKNETDGLLNAKANTADLATVATSGDFDDLSNQPDAAVMGSTLSTPSNVAYVATQNIQDDAVTAAKIADKAVKSQNVDSTILYSNASGATGNITLSDSAANYAFMEIYFKDAVRYGSVKLDEPNGKTTLLFTSSIGSTGNYNNYKIVNVSGTSINVASYNQIAILSTGNTVNSQENILIYKVIGYK